MPIRLPNISLTPDAGAPVLDQGRAVMPSVPRDAGLDDGSLVRGTRSLLSGRPVNASAVNAGVLALQDLGQAFRQAAGVPADFSAKLLQAQNAADIARADVIMRDAVSMHQERMTSLPEDQWEETWEKNGLPEVRKKLDELKLSAAARAQLEPDLIQWESASTIQIRGQATARKIQNNIAAVDIAIERAAIDDDLELAMSHVEGARKSGLFSDTMADDQVNKIYKMVVARAKEQQGNAIVSGIETDPDAIIPELQKAAQGEASSIGKIDPIKARRFLTMAERESKAQRVELRNELHNAILTGEITDPETLRERAGGKLDEKVIQSLERVMGQEISFNPETVSTLRTAIANYDASQDDDMKEYNRLASEIETKIPQRLQGPLNSEINQMWNATVRKNKKRDPHQEFTGGLFSQIDSMAANGMFGEFKKKGKNGTEVDDIARIDAWNKAEAIKDTMRDFLKSNPEASREDAITHFKGLLDPEIQTSAANAIRKKLSTSPGFVPAGMVIVPSAGAVFAPRAPATVRNNNPGAMWFVGGWQKEYGAEVGEVLNDGLGQGNQIARFPTPTHGAAAQFQLLSNYGNQTVDGAIRKWSGGNNVPSYLAKLGQAGFSADERLPEILSDPGRAIDFVRAMSSHETGTDFPLSADQWQEAYAKFRTIKG